jgi:hypothetical protein
MPFFFPFRNMPSEVPPAKRRRLGETIISTALSAALIGTAVGITAYKLWRDRGKFVDAPRQIADVPEREKFVEHESPPPYREDRGWLEAQRVCSLFALKLVAVFTRDVLGSRVLTQRAHQFLQPLQSQSSRARTLPLTSRKSHIEPGLLGLLCSVRK